MAEVQELVRMLKELDDQLVSCMRCGMCQAVCPIYAETGRETDVARGKISLLEGLAHEMIKDPAGVQDRVNKCLLCGSCAANCPSGVKALDIFLKARAILAAYMGLSTTKKLILRGMLANPKLMNQILGVASKFQNIFTKPVNDMLGSSCARFMVPAIGDRHFAPLAKEPLSVLVPSLDTPRGSSGKKVAFFTGCIVDKIFPRIGTATLKVMDHHGVGVFMPSGQGCCGIPALSSGDRETFDKLVAGNLKAFSGGDFDYLITPCATCTSTVKKVWVALADKYPPDMKARILELAAKTTDISAFLVDSLGVRPDGAATNGGGTRVTYHDPCHLKKSLGVSAQPRAILGMNKTLQLVEMAASDACCGMGGSFSLQHYELSKKIGARKREAILATQPGIVATSCPACMLQITDLLSQAGAGVQLRHPIELYAETLS